MNAARVRSAYQKSEAQAEIHPVKLIHLMYERVLTHLEQAEQGLLQKDIKVRGENLSKAIAIITELNAAIKDEDNSEAAEFLRGLYSAILVELPKVGVGGDVEILRQSGRYIKQLKKIWEDTALKEAGFSVDAATGELVKGKEETVVESTPSKVEEESVGNNYTAKSKFKAVKQPPAEAAVGGLSVSI